MIHSIKLTSHLDPRRGYADHPRFDRDVWGLLLAHAFEIADVSIFANSYLPASARRSATGERFSERITRLGVFERLGDQSLRDVRSWTNGGGHVSVLYRVRSTADLLPRLVNLYPRGRTLGDDVRDDLGLKLDETEELRSFVQDCETEHVVLGFASNADPCYIFSSSVDPLALALDRALLLAAPSYFDALLMPSDIL